MLLGSHALAPSATIAWNCAFLAGALAMSLRILPAGFVPPCLPTKAKTPPSGEAWIHKIKHDGFRVIARKGGERVRLYSRPGNDLTDRFPLIVEALIRLRSRSCIIDGEAVACDDKGMSSFDRIRYRQPRSWPRLAPY